jgi:hypothetical protein
MGSRWRRLPHKRVTTWVTNRWILNQPELCATDRTRIAMRVLRGVSEGTRTPDRRDHNPELYQLSYAHQAGQGV